METTTETSNMRALIADDDENARMVLEAILDNIGIKAICVEDGLQLLQRVQESIENIGIILTDHYMPNMKGAEAVRAIRKIAPTLPIIVLSSTNRDEDVANIISSGANIFVEKPVDVSDLQAKVLSLIPSA